MRVFRSEEFMEKDSVIYLHSKTVSKGHSVHSHDFIEIVYITDGEGVQVIDGTSYNVHRGDMLFLNYGSTHSYSCQDQFSYIEIFFSPKLVEDGSITASNALALLALSSFDNMRGGENCGKMSFSGDERKEVEFILSAMLEEQAKYENSINSAKTVMENYLNVLLVKMMRKATNSDETIAEDIWHSLKQYIDDHSEEKITLNSLASKSFYNPSYLSRAFKQKFGISPMEYIRGRKIDLAMSLLSDTDRSIEEIVKEIGFSDRSAFYHAFFKSTGLTPTEYREKNKK